MGLFTNSNVLKFKTGEEFLAYECEFGKTEINPDGGLVGVVVASQEMGQPSAITVLQDGRQRACLKVASRDGGFLVVAETLSAKGNKLKMGDCVIWTPTILSEDSAKQFKDARSGWQGIIRALIKPEIDERKMTYIITCEY